MRSTTKIAFATMLAIGTSTGVYGLAYGDEIVPNPAPLSYDLVAQFGTKAECVPVETIAHQMLIDQGKVGGRTIAMTQGMDQAFADQWRELTHTPSVKVKVVLAHGFATGNASSDVVVDTVEFDENGCAISHTLLHSGAWDAILHGIAGNHSTTKASDSI